MAATLSSPRLVGSGAYCSAAATCRHPLLLSVQAAPALTTSLLVLSAGGQSVLPQPAAQPLSKMSKRVLIAVDTAVMLPGAVVTPVSATHSNWVFTRPKTSRRLLALGLAPTSRKPKLPGTHEPPP